MLLLLLALAFQTQTSNPADALFAQGKFDDARTIYLQELNTKPTDVNALHRLTEIAYYENKFQDCELLARRLDQAAPDKPFGKTLLAECYYRQDLFAEAIPLFRAIGDIDDADLLQSMSGKTPYETTEGFRTGVIPFAQLDPLPVVEVRVNGGPPLRFFIDTGASQVILDKALASSMGLKVFGQTTGTFAGGKQAGLQQTVANSLTLSNFTVKNVPCYTLDLSQLGSILGGKISGCIGTVFLYHFLSTIDYAHKQLVLRPPSEQVASQAKTVRIPFWMAGDHFMFAWAHLNSAPEHLFFVDTGLAGAAVDAPKATLDEAGVKLDPNWSGTGVGAGGPVQITNFWTDKITMGPIVGTHLLGVYDGNFAVAKMFPFQVAGLISHAFFRPYALTFDFRKMEMLLSEE